METMKNYFFQLFFPSESPIPPPVSSNSLLRSPLPSNSNTNGKQMDVALDSLESLWPPYRGAALLGAAQESQGRVRNAGIAVTAGHVAISLDVLPATAAPAATTATADGYRRSARDSSHQRLDERPAPEAAARTGGTTSPRPVRFTALLDAVPASAPRPGTQQMARFLTRVLGRSALGEAVAPAGDGRGGVVRPARRDRVFLGTDIPEILVVEHTDAVSARVRTYMAGFRAENRKRAGRRLKKDKTGRIDGGLAAAAVVQQLRLLCEAAMTHVTAYSGVGLHLLCRRTARSLCVMFIESRLEWMLMGRSSCGAAAVHGVCRCSAGYQNGNRRKRPELQLIFSRC